MTKRSPTARPHADRIPRVPVGPLAPRVLAECRQWLAAQGYSPGSASGIVNLLGRLSVWMRDVGAGVDDLGEELLTRFVAAECQSPGTVECLPLSFCCSRWWPRRLRAGLGLPVSPVRQGAVEAPGQGRPQAVASAIA